MAEEYGRYRQRLSRRAALGCFRRATFAGAGIAIALMGCSRGERAAPESAPAVAQPKKGGTLRFPTVLTRVPYDRGLDPHIQTATRSGRMRVFYQGLLRANPRTWQVEPELAQKWEQPSPTELVFTLQPGVRFHDKPPVNGRQLRVEDVVFSLERVRTNEPVFVNRSLLDSVDKIEAVDQSRVRLTLQLADVTVLDKLTAFAVAILAPEVVERAGRFATADVAVGTGPFVLTEMSDNSAVHARNPHYWKPGLPYLDQIVMLPFGDEEAKWSAFLAGRLDLIMRVPGTVASKHSTQQGQFSVEGKFPAEWAPSPNMVQFFVNVRRTPFGDRRVYRALRLLINHDEVLKVDTEHSSGRGRFSQAFPAAMEQWDFTHEEYKARFLEWKQPKDEAAKVALDLLSAAGFTRDRPLTVSIISQNDADYQTRAQLLQAQWRQFSQSVVQAELKLYDSVGITRIQAGRDYDVLLSGAGPAAAEPDAYLRTFYYTNGSRNYSQWSDPRVNELIDRQRETLQVAQRRAIIKDILVYLIDNAPSVLWAGSYELSAAQPKIKGWTPNVDVWVFGSQYEEVWMET